MEIFLNGVKTPTQASTLSELIAEQSIATAGLAVAIGLRVIRRDDREFSERNPERMNRRPGRQITKQYVIIKQWKI